MCPDQGGDRGTGCAECWHLKKQLDLTQVQYSWLCPWCLGAVTTPTRPHRHRQQGILLTPAAEDVPGFYGSGRCQGIRVDGSVCNNDTGLLSLVVWKGDLQLPSRIDWVRTQGQEE